MNRSLDNWAVVILAAGEGRRMRSTLPKLLHPLAGRPMVRYVVDAARGAGLRRIILVVSPESADIRTALRDGVHYAVQAKPLGTGHAVAQAREAAVAAEHLLVLNGDVPLIGPGTLERLMRVHEEQNADLTFLTAWLEAAEYGLVQRDTEGRVTAIVEAAVREGGTGGDAEINSGQYCFRASWLWPRLAPVPTSASGETYLTSLIETAVNEGATVATVGAVDADEARGINDREQLAQAEAALRRRINRSHMLAGVTIIDPATAYIDADVTIGAETVLEANTQLRGASVIGRDCHIGPNSFVRDSTIGDRCRIESSTVEEATLAGEVDVGPYSHLRPGAHLCAGVHIGNFAEVKNARLGCGVKMGHFSYIGDAEVGDETNIGAGAITCNFDGERKHRTVIGKRAFIGSDTMLVAPVAIGHGARTAAGSVVTKDVPAGALAAGAPARIIRSGKAGEGP